MVNAAVEEAAVATDITYLCVIRAAYHLTDLLHYSGGVHFTNTLKGAS